MMALVSELSMNQAAAMKLQATVKEQEAELEQVSRLHCYLLGGVLGLHKLMDHLIYSHIIYIW